MAYKWLQEGHKGEGEGPEETVFYFRQQIDRALIAPARLQPPPLWYQGKTKIKICKTFLRKVF